MRRSGCKDGGRRGRGVDGLERGYSTVCSARHKSAVGQCQTRRASPTARTRRKNDTPPYLARLCTLARLHGGLRMAYAAAHRRSSGAIARAGCRRAQTPQTVAHNRVMDGAQLASVACADCIDAAVDKWTRRGAVSPPKAADLALDGSTRGAVQVQISAVSSNYNGYSGITDVGCTLKATEIEKQTKSDGPSWKTTERPWVARTAHLDWVLLDATGARSCSCFHGWVTRPGQQQDARCKLQPSSAPASASRLTPAPSRV